MSSSSSLLLYLGGLGLTVLFLFIIEVQKKLDMFDRPVYFEGENFCIRRSLICAILAFVPLWYLMAFRGIRVGSDTIGTYYRYYKYSIRDYPISAFGSEFGYYVLNKAITWFASSYHVVLIVVSSIIWFLYFKYICKNSVSPCISMVVFFLTFFYFRQYNGVRQLLAEAIILQGFHYIYERKFINYCLVIALAFTFHNTAIFLLPVYFLYKIRLTPKMAGIIILLGKFGTSIMVNNVLPYLLKGTKYYKMIYDIRAYKGGYWISDIVVSGTVLLFCLIVLGYDNDSKMSFNSWLILISFLLAINSNMIPMVGRLLWYSNINLMVCVPMLISKYPRKLDKVLVFCVTMLVFGVYFYQQWTLGVDSVQNYAFWGENMQ
ncbi:EpsG family protein [Butyrivibrio proteoclasticus]|uniref:EpsG family protein n=2 Tax=Butyrivibrio proteoclasticus TaxID=43305 RepID=A0A1I5X7C7_9FIRM|nr:EpsG family protein [Butyrivibrio proteoclasticus]